MNLNNKVIKVLNREHGKKVIQLFEDNGVDTRGRKGSCTAEEHGDGGFIYYGVINGYFDNYSLNTLQSSNFTIIELPEESQFPQIMEVSDCEDFSDYRTKVVFMKKNNKYLSWASGGTFEEAEKTTAVVPWNYARPIQSKKEEVVELTLQDISEGKGVGVPSHLIRIKE